MRVTVILIIYDVYRYLKPLIKKQSQLFKNTLNNFECALH